MGAKRGLLGKNINCMGLKTEFSREYLPPREKVTSEMRELHNEELH
jgi:hypothetical protein